MDIVTTSAKDSMVDFYQAEITCPIIYRIPDLLVLDLRAVVSDHDYVAFFAVDLLDSRDFYPLHQRTRPGRIDDCRLHDKVALLHDPPVPNVPGRFV
jgi:hypothetical protein